MREHYIKRILEDTEKVIYELKKKTNIALNEDVYLKVMNIVVQADLVETMDEIGATLDRIETELPQ